MMVDVLGGVEVGVGVRFEETDADVVGAELLDTGDEVESEVVVTIGVWVGEFAQGR